MQPVMPLPDMCHDSANCCLAATGEKGLSNSVAKEGVSFVEVSLHCHVGRAHPRRVFGINGPRQPDKLISLAPGFHGLNFEHRELFLKESSDIPAMPRSPPPKAYWRI